MLANTMEFVEKIGRYTHTHTLLLVFRLSILYYVNAQISQKMKSEPQFMTSGSI